MASRIVKGICDTYKVVESIDAISGEKFLEVYIPERKTTNGLIYEEKYLCDIDCKITDSDEKILNEIDYELN